VDVKNEKIYLNPANIIQLKTEQILAELDPGTSTKVDFSQPFKLFDPNSTQLRRAFDPDYENRPIFERYPDFERDSTGMMYSYGVDDEDFVAPYPMYDERQGGFGNSNTTMEWEPFKKPPSIFDEFVKNPSYDVELRLMPRGAFEMLGQLPKDENSSAFYDHFFKDMINDKQEFGPAFEQMYSRFTKSLITIIVSKPEISEDFLRKSVSAVYGNTMSGDKIAPNLKSIQNNDFVADIQSTNKITPRIRYFDTEPGEPYSPQEISDMRVVDNLYFQSVMQEKFGTDVLDSVTGQKNAAIFLASNRQHDSVRAYKNRQVALKAADWFTYAKAMMHFGVAWAAEGVSYDYRSASEKLYATKQYIGNSFGVYAPEGVQELLEEIKAFNEDLKVVNLFIREEVTKQKALYGDAHELQLTRTPNIMDIYQKAGKLFVSAESKNREIFPKNPADTLFGKTALSLNDIYRGMLSDRPDLIIATLQAIGKGVIVFNDDLMSEKFEYNLRNSMQIISVLGHDFTDSFFVSSQMWFDAHKQATDQLLIDPMMKLYTKLTGVQREHIGINPATAIVTSVAYLTFEQTMYRAVNGVSKYAPQSRTLTGASGDLKLLLESPGASSEVVDPSIDPAYDWQTIGKHAYSQEGTMKIVEATEWFIRSSRALGSFDPKQSNVWWSLKTGVDAVQSGYRGTMKAVQVAQATMTSTHCQFSGVYLGGSL